MAKLGNYSDQPIPPGWWPTLEALRPVHYRWTGRTLSSLGALVDACLNLLPEDRRQIIWLRLGPEKTLQEVGDKHGITRERVRQVVNGQLRTFLKDSPLRLVLDNVFAGLGGHGPLVVNVSGAVSTQVPQALPEELWNFVMNLWNEIQKGVPRSVRLVEGIFLFAPDGLPDEKAVREALMSRASFLYPAQLAAVIGVHPCEVEVVACAFPRLIRTVGGQYGFLGWTQAQVMKAVAEQLARAGYADWHFSELGKAISVFDRSLEGQTARNFAAILSRPDVAHLFEYAGKKGYWRLASLGDGHADNHAAITAVLKEAGSPLHWSEIQARLRRNVNEGTVTALLHRDDSFTSLGKGVYGLAGRSYAPTDREDTFMLEAFAQAGREALDIEEVRCLALTQQLDPQHLMTVGRYSSAFRYWKWGDNEAFFLTPAEANRRFFERWLANRTERRVPAEEVLIDGLEGAFQRRDHSTLQVVHETLKLHGVPLPAQAMHWVDWALGIEAE